MLGNDVIDLEDIDARPETFRPRFDERVFSAEERRVIARDAASLACRWAHWGAKEAAYKLARQLDPHFVFSPIQLTARFEPAEMVSGSIHASASSAISAQTSWVERRGRMVLPAPHARELEIRSYESAQSVHVIALPVDSDWDALVFSVEERSPVSFNFAPAPAPAPAPASTDPSVAVRILAVREIGRNLGVEVDRLSIGRCGKIPTVELDGGCTSLSLSLSHHGRFVAFAMTPTLDVRRGAGVRTGTDMRSETNAGSEMILTDHVMDSVSPKAAAE